MMAVEGVGAVGGARRFHLLLGEADHGEGVGGHGGVKMGRVGGWDPMGGTVYGC